MASVYAHQFHRRVGAVRHGSVRRRNPLDGHGYQQALTGLHLADDRSLSSTIAATVSRGSALGTASSAICHKRFARLHDHLSGGAPHALTSLATAEVASQPGGHHYERQDHRTARRSPNGPAG